MPKQPPPDPPSSSEPPAGYIAEWVPDDAWRMLAPDGEPRRCRRPGCRHRAVAAMARTAHFASGRRQVWWVYCADHLYGRRIHDGRVETRRMRPATSDEWTVEQAAELVFEQSIALLDGCDDDDTVRPAMVLEALHRVWAPNVDVTWPELTAGELRERAAAARARLARGERIP